MQGGFQSVSDLKPASAPKSHHLWISQHGDLDLSLESIVFLAPYELIPEGPLLGVTRAPMLDSLCHDGFRESIHQLRSALLLIFEKACNPEGLHCFREVIAAWTSELVFELPGPLVAVGGLLGNGLKQIPWPMHAGLLALEGREPACNEVAREPHCLKGGELQQQRLGGIRA